MVLENLEPKLIWNLFEKISKIPRTSKKEEKIRSWVKNWAINNQISYKEDKVGNILLWKEPTSGCENYPGII